nr:nucleolar protein 58-like [Tanacetum cinerariifolium]
MNYLEEQTDGEAMINSIKNGDQPLPCVAQVSIVGTSSTEQLPLKDKSMCSDQEKKIKKIDRLARSLLIQGLPNEIYSLIDSNKTAKDLCDALPRHMLGSEYDEQDRKCGYSKDNCELNSKFLNNIQTEWKRHAIMMRQNKNLMNIDIDALYNILKQNQRDVNDAMGLKKKTVVVTSDPLALIAEKTIVSKRKEKVIVSSNSEGSDEDDFNELKKITALLAKAFNQKKIYSKPTNNNLRTSSASISANKKQEYVKSDYKKEEKKVDEKKRDMSKVKCYNCKKECLFAKDCKKAKVKDYEYYKTKMLLAKKDKDEQASSSSSDDKIAEVSYYTSESESESEYETSEYYDNSTTYGLFVDNNDDQEFFHDFSEIFFENLIESQRDHNESDVTHNDSKDNRKQIVDQEILFDKMSYAIVEMNKDVLKLKDNLLEKEMKIYELEECVRNKDLEIEKCLERLNDCENKLHKIRQTNQTIYMIMPSKDKLYNGRKGIGFENPSYFYKAKDLRPTLYDERVINLGYTLMFLTQSNEALEIEKFKRARENKVEFAYDYGNLNETKEKENLETIKSLKSKGFESSEKEISESENQSENNCQVVEKVYDDSKNPNVIAPGFKLITKSDYDCNAAMHADCNSYDVDVNDLFVFDDVSIRKSQVSKMTFRKKRSASLNMPSRNNSKKSLSRNVLKWLPKLQPLAEPVAKWIPRNVKICLWIIDSGCSKHMTGNHALLMNFNEKLLGMVHLGNNDFANY